MLLILVAIFAIAPVCIAITSCHACWPKKSTKSDTTGVVERIMKIFNGGSLTPEPYALWASFCITGETGVVYYFSLLSQAEKCRDQIQQYLSPHYLFEVVPIEDIQDDSRAAAMWDLVCSHSLVISFGGQISYQKDMPFGVSTGGLLAMGFFNDRPSAERYCALINRFDPSCGMKVEPAENCRALIAWGSVFNANTAGNIQLN